MKSLSTTAPEYLNADQALTYNKIITAPNDIVVSQLLLDIHKHDSAYTFSDYLPTWRAGLDEETRILGEIEKLEESDEYKAKLVEATKAYRKDKIFELHPELALSTLTNKYVHNTHKPCDLVSAALAGITNEQVEHARETLNIAYRAMAAGNAMGMLVHTVAAPQHRSLLGKIALNNEAQRLIHEFEQRVTLTDVKLFSQFGLTIDSEGNQTSISQRTTRELVYCNKQYLFGIYTQVNGTSRSCELYINLF